MQNNSFRVINKDSQKPLILTCEHASEKIPEEYNNLGLENKYYDTHIARDKGCGKLTELLAQKLGVTAFIGEYSRLLVDLNRRESEEVLIVKESDKIIIPGNINISFEEKEKRLSAYYRPYHQAIENKIAELKKMGIKPQIFSVHGFTPQLKGGSFRPWNAGILYLEENPLVNKVNRRISEFKDLIIGQNVPYDLRKYNTGASVVHGAENNLENCLIEIRDDEFSDMEKGASKWCDILTYALS